MNASSHTIAIVDDDAQVRRAISRLLKAHGYSPLTFPSAEQYIDENPDVACLLLDIDMGGMSGIELYKLLQERLPAAPPAIFVTGTGTPATERAARELNCAAYLSKPFNASALLDAIKRAVGTAGFRE